MGLRLAGRGRENAKKRAVVAVARKLAVLMHWLWVNGEVYQFTRTSGSRPAQQSQLSGHAENCPVEAAAADGKANAVALFHELWRAKEAFHSSHSAYGWMTNLGSRFGSADLVSAPCASALHTHRLLC